MNFLFIHLGEKRGGGGALVYVYVLSALTIESLDGYLPNSVGIKNSWPPHICIDFWAKSAKGRIQGRAIIRQWGAFSKGLLLQSWKATAINRMHSSDLKHVGRSVVIFGFIRKSNFWRVFDVFLDLVILVYFNAFSIDFYSVKSFICITFV